MRTNKACPMYAGNTSSTQPINVALTEEQEEEMEKGGIEESEELINVDGTKIKLSSKVIKVKNLFYQVYNVALYGSECQC